jgi:rare lipoprotein A
VRNLKTGKTITVRITDRGPFVAGRVIDLSTHAAQAIGIRSQGVGRVEVSLMGRRTSRVVR